MNFRRSFFTTRLQSARWSLCTLVALTFLASNVPVAVGDRPADLSARIAKVLETATPKNATVGLQLLALGDSPSDKQVLFSRAADRPMIPASNLKLLTTAAALDALGKDFRFQTQLLIRRNPQTGQIELAVIGDGDPSFGDAGLLKSSDGWGTRTIFASWAEALRARGVMRISALYLDDGVFDEQHAHPNWPDNQRHRWYEAQVGGLNLNINCVNVHLSRGAGETMSYRLDPPTRYVNVTNTCRRGNQNAVSLTRIEGGNTVLLGGQTNSQEQGPLQVTIYNPTGYFGTVFSEVLAEAGVECAPPVVDRTIRLAWQAQQSEETAGQTSSKWQVLAVHQTPMATVLARTNKDSINLYAEALAKRMAFASTGRPGSWADAEQVLKSYLSRIGLEADHVRMDDGSGMSRFDRASAAAICDVLAAMHYSEAADMFRDSLSEAGVDGTLQKRFRIADRRDLHGRVFGKTGYINGVCTFSGYLHARDGQWYAFSILVNDNANLAAAQQMQEQVIVALDRALEPSAATAGAR